MKLLYFLSIILLVDNGACYLEKLKSLLNDQSNSTDSVFTPKVKELIIPIVQHAAKTCQEMFQWDAWNCQEADFGEKLFSKSLDRETLNVHVLVQTILIYEITVACSYDLIEGCEIDADIPSHDLEFAFEVIEALFEELLGNDVTAYSLIRKHNMDLVKHLFSSHIHHYCECKYKNDICYHWMCVYRLVPYSDILQYISQKLDSAILGEASFVPKLILKKSMNNTLIYLHKSRDYCKTDIATQWVGVKGRECPPKNGEPHWDACEGLCQSCGLRVEYIKQIKMKPCKCFNWVCCGMKCNNCLAIDKTLLCN